MWSGTKSPRLNLLNSEAFRVHLQMLGLHSYWVCAFYRLFLISYSLAKMQESSLT